MLLVGASTTGVTGAGAAVKAIRHELLTSAR